jgi:hypothetical protein
MLMFVQGEEAGAAAWLHAAADVLAQAGLWEFIIWSAVGRGADGVDSTPSTECYGGLIGISFSLFWTP